MIFKNDYGSIELSEEYYNNKTIGLSMSGGADSTMLCILFCKLVTTHNINLTIQPYNGFDIHVPFDSSALLSNLDIIKNMYSNVDLLHPISTIFDSKGEDNKMIFINDLIFKLNRKVFDHRVTAITLGPPYNVQKEFPCNHIRRIEGYHAYNELDYDTWPIENCPLKNIDKRFIVQLYKDFELTDLFTSTISCISPVNDLQPCNKCWWCYERDWAITEVL
jgi:hypothetical protein